MDMIQLTGGAVGSLHRVGWTGPWPPPETLLGIRGHATGQVIVRADDLEKEQLDELVLSPAVAVTRYRLDTFSELPPQNTDDTKVVRGASYTVDQELAIVLVVHE